MTWTSQNKKNVQTIVFAEAIAVYYENSKKTMAGNAIQAIKESKAFIMSLHERLLEATEL